jgi:hypothetical protein
VLAEIFKPKSFRPEQIDLKLFVTCRKQYFRTVFLEQMRQVFEEVNVPRMADVE